MVRVAAETGRFAAALLVATALSGQGHPVVLRAAIAPAPMRTSVPALDWLIESGLRSRTQWPKGLDAAAALSLTLTADGLELLATHVALPPDVVACGSCTIGDGPPALWQCARDGVEDWFVPLRFAASPRWLSLLAMLEADPLDTPRRIDAGIVLGHLAGAVAEGDEQGHLLQLAATLCGTVTWTAWRTPAHLRVRGRSDGGLLLPATLLALAARAPASSALSLRAFAARDDDRAEAARQLSRYADGEAIRTLRAMLFADDPACLAAIDALVRRGDAASLPDIVAAATVARPLATQAASDAVRSLWPAASPETRQRTRAALVQSANIDMRQLDVGAHWRQLPNEALPVDDGSRRARWLLGLLLLGLGTHGMWQRERSRLRLQTI